MFEYGQYCPIARAAEIIAERWTPLIVRELLSGIERFNDLQRGLPGISRSLLLQRLRGLERAGVVEREVDARGRTCAYRLTPAGKQLEDAITTLGAWSARWTFGHPREHELDPVLLLWWMRRGIDPELLPPHRLVVQFDFPRARPSRLWLVCERADVSACIQHPGFDVDVVVTADLATLFRVCCGEVPLRAALAQGTVRVDGNPELVRTVPGWLPFSHVPDVIREATRERLAAEAWSGSWTSRAAAGNGHS